MYVHRFPIIALLRLIGPRTQLRVGPQGAPARDEPPAERGGQRLLQRKVHGRGRRPAAVRRCARERHERQGGQHLDLLPLRVRAQHQGELCRARGLPLPLEPRVSVHVWQVELGRNG